MLSKAFDRPVGRFVKFVIGTIMVLGVFTLLRENVPVLSRYQHFIIVTDSMEPTIDVGDVVLINKDKPYDIGDIIAFNVVINNQEVVVVHYLAEANDGLYRTRPEGTQTLDSWVLEEDAIIGTYATHVPFVGRFLLFAQSPVGVIVIILDIIVIYIIYKMLWKK